MSRLVRPSLVAGICALSVAGAAHAAEPGPYPSRAVRMVVPFAPGGSDIIARMMAPRLSEKLGQSFVVENRPGAASVLGADVVAKAPPDGHTLLFCTSSITTTAAYNRTLPYDVARDFSPVAHIGWLPFVLVVHPALPVRSVKEFVAFAKKRPGQLNYSSPGTGGIGHLANEYFAKETGIKVSHVPYKGTGPMLTALLVGEIQFSMPQVSGALTLIQSGKVRPLGVAAAQRMSIAPELATLRESGVDLVTGPWYGVVAPRGTPQPVVDTLNREFNALAQSVDMKEKLAARGMVVDVMTPADFAAFIKADIARWVGVMQAAGIPQE